MGETSDPSPEGQRGNPVRIREGRDVPGNRKRKVPGARKEAQNDWGMVRSSRVVGRELEGLWGLSEHGESFEFHPVNNLREAWRAAVHVVTKSRTQLRN